MSFVRDPSCDVSTKSIMERRKFEKLLIYFLLINDTFAINYFSFNTVVIA